MKKLLQRLGSAVVLSVFSLSFTGCATRLTTASDTTGPRFYDEAQVNAVLQFSSWDYTFLVRPQYSENGFLQQVSRGNIRQAFDRLNVPRGTAAVVVGWTYNGDALNKIVADWKTILAECGFQRVVILRSKPGHHLNGSVIVDDTSAQVSFAPGRSRG